MSWRCPSRSASVTAQATLAGKNAPAQAGADHAANRSHEHFGAEHAALTTAAEEWSRLKAGTMEEMAGETKDGVAVALAVPVHGSVGCGARH